MRANPILPSRVFALASLGILSLFMAMAAPGEAGAQSEWRVYRSPAHGFRILYPPHLTAKALDHRPAEGTVVVQEWRREDGKALTRLTLIDKPAGLSLRDWIGREHAGRFAETTVAGQPAFVIEAVFEAQLTTEVYLEARKSGTVINFTHAVSGIADWMGQPLNRVKNRYRAELTDFWNMVESIKFRRPEDE